MTQPKPPFFRRGSLPFLITEREGSAQALLEVVQEAPINDVSTRKMNVLAQSLGIESLSAFKSQQSLKPSMIESNGSLLLAKSTFTWVDVLKKIILRERYLISRARLSFRV